MALYRCGDPSGLIPAMVEKRWLAVFFVTCKLGLAGGLDILQLHVDSVISCLCWLPTEPSPDRAGIKGRGPEAYFTGGPLWRIA